MTQIHPHALLSPEHPIDVEIAFTASAAAELNWSQPSEAVLHLHARLVTLGGFQRSLPQLRWQARVVGPIIHATYERLPADPSTLPVLARMLLALPTPPAHIHIRGTAAGADTFALPSTVGSLGLLPRTRSPCAFALEIEPGGHGLCLDVTRHEQLDMAAAQLIDERVDVWCAVGRAGGLSELGDDGTVSPGDVGKSAPAVGFDSYSTELMFDGLDLAAPAALVNLLDELSRTQVPIASVWIR